MFRCQKTGKLSKPKQKPERVVVETREKKYFRKDKYGNDVLCGNGWEIVKEIIVLK